ncbi:helix-turn-helix domain-containing protein [Carnobacterium gallinarum]|uniref:helix-turn-helix domain-containing protein n=1 Tax=Carnobacterium gallinarum TaxID=2749 RepID=UPI000554A29A|nr:helix-turn-helix transcriptional regulator [Carnobacterium gallinarum]
MGQLGKKIKASRLAKGMTQSELAEGICTQATISNLESDSSVPSLETLLSIADRLNIEFSEISEYAMKNESTSIRVFSQVKELCSQFKYQEAYSLLTKEITLDELETSYEKKEYYYYFGITALLGEKNYSDAHYNFNLALFLETGKHLNLLDVSITNGIGLAYSMNSETDKALTYFEKSLQQLDEVMERIDTLQDSKEVIRIYFNTAKFYAQVEKYNKAINLCSLGIALEQNQNMNYILDELTYEKAYSLFKLGQTEDAELFYCYTATLARLSNNDSLVKKIKKDMKEFGLKGYKYW